MSCLDAVVASINVIENQCYVAFAKYMGYANFVNNIGKAIRVMEFI